MLKRGIHHLIAAPSPLSTTVAHFVRLPGSWFSSLCVRAVSTVPGWAWRKVPRPLEHLSFVDKLDIHDPRERGQLLVQVDEADARPLFKCETLQESEEADSAALKEVVSLKFGSGWERRQARLNALLSLFNLTPADKGSLLYKILNSTVTIQSVQEHCLKFGRDTKGKVTLKETIEKRRKYLRQLRTLDFEQYQACLDGLGIVHQVRPLMVQKLSLREALRLVRTEKVKAVRLTNMAEEERMKKLQEITQAIESQTNAESLPADEGGKTQSL